MKKLKMGIIGLGQRGYYMYKDLLSNYEKIEVTAICDLYEDRVERVSELMREKQKPAAFGTTDYKEVLKHPDVECVYIATSWKSHVEIAIEAMKAGVIVALEVGGAHNLDDCFNLVRTYEQTGTPIMLMENCCYGESELLATSLVRKGKLGEIVFCSGAYAHDLRGEISKGNIIRHYRLEEYTNRNCENYPTHELGPIAKLLGINRGNRMVSLVSVSSSAKGLEAYIEKEKLYEQDPTLKGRIFNQGDIVTTLIKCENGEVIKLTLDTTLPRTYSRELNVRGTEGYYYMPTNTVFFDGMIDEKDEWLGSVKHTEMLLDNAKTVACEYMPEVWRNITEEQRNSGHGGMDEMMFDGFVDSALNGKEMPIDVYDAAAWMCITCLSEKSIAEGGAPQLIPDFTNGEYKNREIKDVIDL